MVKPAAAAGDKEEGPSAGQVLGRRMERRWVADECGRRPPRRLAERAVVTGRGKRGWCWLEVLEDTAAAHGSGRLPPQWLLHAAAARVVGS